MKDGCWPGAASLRTVSFNFADRLVVVHARDRDRDSLHEVLIVDFHVCESDIVGLARWLVDQRELIVEMDGGRRAARIALEHAK